MKLTLAALALAATAHAQSPCSLLSPAQLKSVVNAPLTPKPGPSDCTWRDAKGQDRIYLSLKDAGPDFHDLRNQMQSSGHMVPLPGLAEDAFYVRSAGSSSALYLLKKKRLLLLSVTGPDFDRGQNEAAEKALAPAILAKL